MKKIIALVLAALMMFSLVACTKATDDTSSAPAAPTTVGEILCQSFKDQIAANPAITNQELAQNLLSNEIIQFAGMPMPMEAGYLAGFKADITGFTECVAFAPMIGTIPFVGYVFTLDPAADVNAFMQTLKDNADLRWNICTEAEEMVVDNVNNRVFFVMCPKSFETPETPDDGGMAVEGEGEVPLGDPVV